MQLNGSIRTAGTPSALIDGLADKDTLVAVAPQGFSIRGVENGVTSFAIRRGFGPITLTLQGTMTLKADGGGRRLVVHGSHLIGGAVDLDLTLMAEEGDEGLGKLSWTGDLAAKGLAGRLLNDHEDRADRIVRNLFQRLRRQIEDGRA